MRIGVVVKGECKCEYNVEREVVVVKKEKFVILSQKKKNEMMIV